MQFSFPPIFFVSGAIREGGGAFGAKEKAHEDMYFRQLEQKQLEQIGNLKDQHKVEIDNHLEQIKRHEEAVKKHQESLKELEK